MSEQPRPEFLATVTPLSGLDFATLQAIVGDFELRTFDAEEAVGRFVPGQDEGLYVIDHGAVRLEDEQGQVLEQRGEGELFGHAICLDSDYPPYRVVADEVTRSWYLAPGPLQKLIAAHPEVAHFFSAGPGDRLRSLHQSSPANIAGLGLRTPVTAGPQTSIVECARRMAEHRISCLPLVDDDRLVGIVTDRDLRNRVLAGEVDPESPVERVMTPDPTRISNASTINDALVEMMRLGIHHLPVCDESGRLAGVISAGDLLRQQSPHPLQLVRAIQRAGSDEEVAQVACRGPGVLASLAASGSQATEIGRVAGMLTDASTRRLLALAQADLGPPPMDWAWLAFGSQARMEQGLVTDQDNGLLLAEEPDADGREYFRQMAERVCRGLDAGGYVFCPGGVMAMGEWRMSRAAWQSTFKGWIQQPEPKSVMQSSIFFDLRVVDGDPALGAGLQETVLRQARDREIFRRFLAAESMSHTPPIGLFRRFVQESDGRQSQGLNLKKRGVIPIVDLARVRALEGAIQVVQTEARLKASAEAGNINARDADDLIHAFRFIANLRLHHQVRQFERGERPDHLVNPDELSGLHRRYLRSAFGIVRAAQKALAQRYVL